jgi:hypothetical protein
MIHMGFPDPALAIGPEADVVRFFHDVRDQIRQRLIPLLEEELAVRESQKGCRERNNRGGS